MLQQLQIGFPKRIYKHGNILKVLWFCRQGGKDQTKKGPNVKLGPQGDKKGLVQDPRKDGSMDHLKVRLRKYTVYLLCTVCKKRDVVTKTSSIGYLTAVLQAPVMHGCHYLSFMKHKGEENSN